MPRAYREWMQLGGKRLQLLREIMPSLTCVAVLGTTPTTNPYSGPFVDDLRVAAAKAGLRLQPVLVSGPHEFESAFAEMSKVEARALIVQEHYDPYRAVLLPLATKHKLAYMAGTRETTRRAIWDFFNSIGHFLSLPHRISNDRFTSVKRHHWMVRLTRAATHVALRLGSPRCAVTLTRTH
jgi:hypothetical protein